VNETGSIKFLESYLFAKTTNNLLYIQTNLIKAANAIS